MASFRRKLFSAFGLSLMCHGGLLMLLLVLASTQAERVDTRVPPVSTGFVFLQESRPAGGGGGRFTEAAPAKLQIPKPVPEMTLVVPPKATPVEPPPPSLDAPLYTGSVTALLGGGTNSIAAPGPAGRGPGRGLGDGDGPGLDKGKGGGRGEDTKGSGNLTPPSPIRTVRPEYTSQALQARLQGSVTLEVEVLANGTVGAVKVLKSLDTRYGLDGQAIRCARQWVFRPGTINGKPVDSLVQIILEFGLR
ncbi:MAG TPA: TonB family protein [Vicinamibacterales bacterium]|nr:TonB family protein [Vicinamibacterales bacterium]